MTYQIEKNAQVSDM